MKLNERNGSDGETDCGDFTFSPAQHDPVDSPLHFNVL